LANLLRNAEEHGSGVHELKVHMAGSSVVFSVEDRGPGFDDLDQAFSRGYQGADGKGALGLGLALVRRIAEAHGGSAHAENLPQGARVSLHLPTPPSTLPT
jgi:signal transduction histidine kinase